MDGRVVYGFSFFSLGLLFFGYYSRFVINSNELVMLVYFIVSIIWAFVIKLVSFEDFGLLIDNKMK